MSEPFIMVERDLRGIATVTLNRPQVNNAYNRKVLQSASDGLKELAQDAD